MSAVKEITESGLELSDMEPMFYDEYVTLPKQLFDKIEWFKPKLGKLTLISTPDRNGNHSSLKNRRDPKLFTSATKKINE